MEKPANISANGENTSTVGVSGEGSLNNQPLVKQKCTKTTNPPQLSTGHFPSCHFSCNLHVTCTLLRSLHITADTLFYLTFISCKLLFEVKCYCLEPFDLLIQSLLLYFFVFCIDCFVPLGGNRKGAGAFPSYMWVKAECIPE